MKALMTAATIAALLLAPAAISAHHEGEGCLTPSTIIAFMPNGLSKTCIKLTRTTYQCD
jgi:hypothetical protein